MNRRLRARAAGLLLLLLAFPGPAPAQSPPPAGLGAGGIAAFERYRQLGFNKVFAANRDGKWSYRQHADKTVQALVEETLQSCNRDARQSCRVLSVNDRDTASRDALSLPETEAPALGPLNAAPHYPIRGPAIAAGILIWSHGVLTGADNTRHPPQGYVNRFRDAGYDVYKFDRRWPSHGKDLGTLRSAVETARQAGYRRVILAGQSAGAWLSLAAAAQGASVDGVIAAAPARFGKEISSTRREKNRDELGPVLEVLAGRDLPVAIMFFAGDDYDPGGRSQVVQTLVSRASRARIMLIDGPPGITGHGGGGSSKFVLEYGACLAEFLLEETRSPPCAG
ncbi:MAG: hypothetical protein L6R19_06520 [Alphaproteobacteria bacterium]|nr:hypothetical protein [Alphaproteobacteria bacterium]